MKKFQKILRTIIVVILILVILISGYEVISYLMDRSKEVKPERDLRAQIEEESTVDDNGFQLSRKAWEDLKSKNSDIVGYLAFPDGFVKEPIAQAPVNNPDKYLRHWIDGAYSTFGTVFIDGDNSLDDQNITMYGHSYDMDTKTKFSPLTLLTNQEEWEKHHTFTIWYDDRIATYEIVAVREDDTYVNHRNFDFTQRNFKDQNDFDNYMTYVRKHNLIDSHGDAENMPADTRFVTLQTCKRKNARYHIVLTCKQVSERKWE